MFNTVEEFVAALNTAFTGTGYSFAIEGGRKYKRIVSISPGSSRSAYCFVDAEGNIYKTASWKAPAKGARATLAGITKEQVDAIASAGYATTLWLYR